MINLKKLVLIPPNQILRNDCQLKGNDIVIVKRKVFRSSQKAEDYSFETDQTTGSLDLNNQVYSPSKASVQVCAGRTNQGVLSVEHLPNNREIGAHIYRGTGVVDRQHLSVIEQISDTAPTTEIYSDICLQTNMGSCFERCENRRSLEFHRDSQALLF